MSSTTRKHAGRVGAVIAAAAMGLAVSPAIASAADGEGVRTGPVQWWAEGNDQCEVTFHISNTTNSNRYAIDYLVDGEDPKTVEGSQPPTGQTYDFKFDGTDQSRTVGRIAVWAKAEAPLFGEPGAGYVKDRAPQSSDSTVNLRELTGLPISTADTHEITYQMVIGPDSRDKGWDAEKKEFPVFTTTVTGCSAPEPEAPGSLGSLFGSLGSFAQS